jgi:N-acetylmuramoyl-L-alanine amidase
MVKIYLDAGHGGKDSGAVGNGLLEKNVTLEIIKRIDALLRANYKDVEIMQTRTTDVFLTLDERTNKANNWKADVFLAVHINSGPTSARGFESHIYTDVGADTKAFQNVMHENIFGQVRADGVTDRGKKQSNFHVLRESTND